MADLIQLPDAPAPAHARSVSDLRLLIGDGETRTFTRTMSPTGDEVAFYEMKGPPAEYGGHPRWINRPDLVVRPRPAMHGRAPISLASHGDFEFELDSSRKALAAYYHMGWGLSLAHNALIDIALSKVPGAVETHPVRLHTPQGEPIGGFQIILSNVVIDAVDISKTDVLVKRPEIVDGSGSYITHVAYGAAGYVIADHAAGNACFTDMFGIYWLWREDLVRRIGATGVLGVNCVHTYKRSFLDQIRFVHPALKHES